VRSPSIAGGRHGRGGAARRRNGVGAYRVLITWGVISEETYVRFPELSAATGGPHWTIVAIVAAAVALAAIAAPDATRTATELVLGLIFLAWTGLRLLGLVSERFVWRLPRTFSDEWLPTYSIIIALYREAAAVDDLVAALRAFNYPLEKLDISLCSSRTTTRRLRRLVAFVLVHPSKSLWRRNAGRVPSPRR
jgi:hypothetical protein